MDTWRFDPTFPGRWSGGAIARSQADMDGIADGVARRFAGDERVILHRMTSAAFFASAPLLDWIYIDGDHSYKAALSDLNAAWPVLKPGGVLCGDDYFDGDDIGLFGVKSAVETFCAALGVTCEPGEAQQFHIAKSI